MVSLWGPVHGVAPLVPSLLPWLPRRAGSRAQGREEGRGREHLARQQAGERSGWQSVLALGGDSGREQRTRVWRLEEKWLGERGFIDSLQCAESFARPCR